MSAPIVDCEGLVHIYKTRDLEVVALQGLDLAVEHAEVVAIVGRSGSGKTTLMNILASIEVPTAGKAMVAGNDLARMTEPEREAYRHAVTGYVVQNPQANLVADLDALENVMLPMTTASQVEKVERAESLLEALAITKVAHRFPGELSGGEAQRVAVAIAMANDPKLLLADEPTAELDQATAAEFLRDVRVLLRARGTVAVMVTHDHNVEKHADRVIQIRDGRTSTETRWREEQGTFVADEVLIMDRAGRIQLPKAFVERLRLRGRVRAHLEGGEVRIRPAEENEPNE
jgi:ABC-type lipoprotein export system ATPase subunit